MRVRKLAPILNRHRLLLVALGLVWSVVPALPASGADGDLTVTMSVDPAIAVMPSDNRQKVHAITVENRGNSQASNVKLVFETSGTIPPEADPAEPRMITSSQGWVCDQPEVLVDQGNVDNYSVTCAPDNPGSNMAPDSFARINITTDVVLAKDVTTRAQVSADGPDPNPANNVVAYPVAAATAAGTQIYISDASGSEADGIMVFTARLGRAAAAPVSFDYRTYGGTASSGADYTPVSGTLTFLPGQTTKDVAVNIQLENDGPSEGPEEMFLLLSNAAGPHAAFGDHQGTGTITDALRAPDAPFALTASASDGRVKLSWAVPNNDGGSELTHYKIYRANSLGEEGALVAAAPRTATTFIDTPPHETPQDRIPYFYTVTAVNAVGEGARSNEASAKTSDEAMSDLALTVAFPHKYPEAPPPPPDPSLDVGPHLNWAQDVGAIVVGADSREQAITVENRGPSTAENVELTFRTKEAQEVLEGDCDDPTAVSLEEPPRTWTCSLGDIAADSFGTVRLRSVACCHLDRLASAMVSSNTPDLNLANNFYSYNTTHITSIRVTDATEAEGADGKKIVFTAALARSSPLPVSAEYRTYDGTAKAHSDYTSSLGRLVFLPGETTTTISVPLADDGETEGAETFFLVLSNASANAGFDDNQALGTIQNNSRSRRLPATVSLSPGSATGRAPGSHTVTASVKDQSDPPAPLNLTKVRFEVSGANSASGEATTDANGIASFSYTGLLAGRDSLVAYADANDDGQRQSNEPQATATRTWNAPPSPTSVLIIDDVVAPEGVTGPGTITPFKFNVTLSPPRSEEVKVHYFVGNGTASKTDGDFGDSTTPTPLVFAPGQTQKQIAVPVVADNTPERDEFFQVFLTDNENSVVAKAQGIGIIRDDDGGNAPALVTISDAVQEEGNGQGFSQFNFKVALSAPSGAQPVTVRYKAFNGTAESGTGDYTPVDAEVIFSPGETEKMITVSVGKDAAWEYPEFFQVYLVDVQNAATAKSQALGVITNDDS